MANTVLNPSIIAKTSVRILENELVMGGHVYRGFEEEFDRKINGYDVGDTISIRKPQNFAIRTGATAVMQDVTEGKLSLTVNIQQGVDFNFSSRDLTLKIEQLADRVIRPAMVRLANAVDVSLMGLYTQIPNWVGQPDTGADATLDSFADFARGAERLDQMAVPGDMGGVGTYMSQNVPTFTATAVQGDSPTVTNAVATNQVLYDTVKNTEGTP